MMLRDSAASRCGFSPVAMILVSFSGSMPIAAECEAQSHVRSRAQTIDAAGLALELFHGRYVGQRNYVIDE